MADPEEHRAAPPPQESEPAAASDFEPAQAEETNTADSHPPSSDSTTNSAEKEGESDPSRPPPLHIVVPGDASTTHPRVSLEIPNLADDIRPLRSGGPPPLNYTLRTRYWSILIFWTLILVDSIAVPVGLYFGLWYGTSLSPNAVFSISTGCLGGVSIFEYFLRFYRLWKKGSTCRVIGARRWYLDWFHWNFSAAWIFIMAELIIGTVFTNPPIRLLAMPVPSLCFWFGASMCIQDGMRLLHYSSPIRISSVPKGAPLRMAIYNIIEDVIAVDGGGGTEFRVRLNIRYEASHWFRLMLHRLTLFWAAGSLAIALLCTILIFTLNSGDIAYIIGWSLPFVWAGIWALPTWWYVKRCLKREREMWGSHRKDSFVIQATPSRGQHSLTPA